MALATDLINALDNIKGLSEKLAHYRLNDLIFGYIVENLPEKEGEARYVDIDVLNKRHSYKITFEKITPIRKLRPPRNSPDKAVTI